MFLTRQKAQAIQKLGLLCRTQGHTHHTLALGASPIKMVSRGEERVTPLPAGPTSEELHFQLPAAAVEATYVTGSEPPPWEVGNHLVCAK